MAQVLCLKWDDHMNNIMEVFQNLLSAEEMVDVTLACDGLSLKAHKVVLSACSPFFRSLFLDNPCKHPIVIVKDMKYTHLKAIIDFMYHGEVNVSHNDISSIIKSARTLKVKGLSDVTKDERQSNDDSPDSKTRTSPRKRKRRRIRKRQIHEQQDYDKSSHCKSRHQDSDVEDLSRQSGSDIEELSSNVAHNTVTPKMASLSSHKLQQVPDKNEYYIEDIFEVEETKFSPEFEVLLRQNLTEENSTGTTIRSNEVEDDFLPAAAMLLQQTLTKEVLSKTTTQSDVEELSTHPGSDIDEWVQSNTEPQAKPHSTTNHATVVVASSSGLDSFVPGTCAPMLADPLINDPRARSSTDLDADKENSAEALTQSEKEHGNKCSNSAKTSGRSRKIHNYKKTELRKQPQRSANHILASIPVACRSKPSESSIDEAGPSHSADENTHMNIELPRKTIPSVLNTSQTALIQGSSDSQLKGHKKCYSAKVLARSRKTHNVKKKELKKQPHKSTNHTSALVPGTSKTKSSKSSKVLKKQQVSMMKKALGSPSPGIKRPSRKFIHHRGPVLKSNDVTRCNICKKQFCSKYYLAPHMRIHLTEKPYACDFCDYKSSFLHSLKHHQLKKCSVR